MRRVRKIGLQGSSGFGPLLDLSYGIDFQLGFRDDSNEWQEGAGLTSYFDRKIFEQQQALFLSSKSSWNDVQLEADLYFSRKREGQNQISPDDQNPRLHTHTEKEFFLDLEVSTSYAGTNFGFGIPMFQKTDSQFNYLSYQTYGFDSVPLKLSVSRNIFDVDLFSELYQISLTSNDPSRDKVRQGFLLGGSYNLLPQLELMGSIYSFDDRFDNPVLDTQLSFFGETSAKDRNDKGQVLRLGASWQFSSFDAGVELNYTNLDSSVAEFTRESTDILFEINWGSVWSMQKDLPDYLK